MAGTAPEGTLLKGTWSLHSSKAAANEEIPVAFSTGIPVKPVAGTPFVIYLPEGHAADPSHPLGCTGTAVAPASMVAGVLCVYKAKETNLTDPVGFPFLSESGAGVVALFKATAEGLVSGYGSWALRTGEEG